MICLASNSTSKRYSIFSFDLFHYSILIIIFNIEFPSIKYTQAESYRTLSAFFAFRYLICKYTESYIIVYQIESDSFLHIPISYWTKWNLLQIQKITKFLRINQYNKTMLVFFQASSNHVFASTGNRNYSSMFIKGSTLLILQNLKAVS